MTHGSSGSTPPAPPEGAAMEDLLVRAATHHQAGRLSEAEQLYRAVLESLPYSADAHHNLGVICMQRGRSVEEALPHFRIAWEADPTHPQFGASLARALAHAGRADEARDVLSDGLRRNPPRPSFEALAAGVFPGTAAPGGAGDPSREPQDGFGWRALALALRAQGRHAEALGPMQNAARLLPHDAWTIAVLGVVLAELGQHRNAEAALRHAIAAKGDFALAQVALGDVLRMSQRLPEAETAFRQALASQPDLAEAHAGLGETLQAQGRTDEAMASLQRALDLKPDHVAAYACLGQILLSRQRIGEAEALCRRVLAALPSRFEAHRDLGALLAMRGRLREAAASCRSAVALRPDDLGVRSALLFNLNYVSGEPMEVLLAEARAYGEVASRRATRAFTTWACPPAPQRLRVGFVSADLGEHPVGYFLEGLLAHGAPGKIDWFAYPTQPDMDGLSMRLRARVAKWQCLAGLGDEAAARRIHDDGIHILLDLSGHTGRNRLPVFALRPAPVQASWLGYFATTGVAQIDYLLADRTSVPPAIQNQFTERIWYLPETRLCFTPPEAELPVAALPASSRGYVTFGCFQALAKVNDDVLSLWRRVLAQCAGARLRLQARSLSDAPTAESLRGRLRDLGIDPGRVDLHGHTSRPEYLEAHAETDILLDTFPYNGGTTTCEALWMGVPTVTLAGERMIARQGASLLCAAGLPEWVAQTPDAYVALACEMAGDLPRLAALRKGLRERLRASALFDAARFARHFEDALRGMWEARGKAPREA